jgi:hypothetical protein
MKMDCYICLDENVIEENTESCGVCKQPVCGVCFHKITECPNCRNCNYGDYQEVHVIEDEEYEPATRANLLELARISYIQSQENNLGHIYDLIEAQFMLLGIDLYQTNWYTGPTGQEMGEQQRQRIEDQMEEQQEREEQRELEQQDRQEQREIEYQPSHSNMGTQVYQIDEEMFKIKKTAKSVILTLSTGKKFIFKIGKDATRKINNGTFTYTGNAIKYEELNVTLFKMLL